MTTWILIIFFMGYSKGGATSVEFSEPTRCETAKQDVAKEWSATGWGDRLFIVCVRK